MEALITYETLAQSIDHSLLRSAHPCRGHRDLRAGRPPMKTRPARGAL
jgi:hypothetical protein